MIRFRSTICSWRINIFVAAALADIHEQLERYYSEIGRQPAMPQYGSA
jgi:hypothetical protein